MDNIILIKQYRIEHEFNKSNIDIRTKFDEDPQENQNTVAETSQKINRA